MTRTRLLAALIMSRWAEPAGRGGLELDSLDVPVKREIEIEPRLLAVGDYLEAGAKLVADGDADRVVDEFGAIGPAEAVEMLAG